MNIQIFTKKGSVEERTLIPHIRSFIERTGIQPHVITVTTENLEVRRREYNLPMPYPVICNGDQRISGYANVAGFLQKYDNGPSESYAPRPSDLAAMYRSEATDLLGGPRKNGHNVPTQRPPVGRGQPGRGQPGRGQPGRGQPGRGQPIHHDNGQFATQVLGKFSMTSNMHEGGYDAGIVEKMDITAVHRSMPGARFESADDADYIEGMHNLYTKGTNLPI